MNIIEEVFDRMDRWRNLPKYALERRADIFFGVYLRRVLEAKYRTTIKDSIIPEFPVHKASIYPDLKYNRSFNIDFVAFSEDSKTAFLVEHDDGYRLRWFTPKIEVDLCGHATLASAHVLWTEGRVPLEQEIHFHTNSGLLKASRRGHLMELDFPSQPASQVEPSSGLLEALGVSAKHVGKNRFDYLVELDSEEELRGMKPDFAQLGKNEVRGVIVTSRSASPKYDFVSRFFAPWAGIDEDPVTGSAHCCLGPYWQKQLGKDEMMAFQASARGGVVRVRVVEDRVILGGNAVTVMKGELL